MTQLTALKELAEKIEAGTDFINGPLDDAVAAIKPVSTFETDMEAAVRIRDAQRGSLDAAHALHKAVLGDDTKAMLNTGDYPSCRIFKDWSGPIGMGDSTTPARAWLLAVIRAKISELENAT